jgi:hypothetical protein
MCVLCVCNGAVVCFSSLYLSAVYMCMVYVVCAGETKVRERREKERKREIRERSERGTPLDLFFTSRHSTHTYTHTL